MSDLGCTSIESHGTGRVVVMSGEFDQSDVDRLRDELNSVVVEPVGQVRLDLAGVTFLGSAILRLLFELRNQVVAAGGTLQVTRMSSFVARLLEITSTGPLLGVGGPTGVAPTAQP